LLPIPRILAEKYKTGERVRVAIVGAGYSGRHIAHQIVTSFPGMTVAVIASRTVESARTAFAAAGVTAPRVVGSKEALEAAVDDGSAAITDCCEIAWAADKIDVVVEATGTVEFGCHVVLGAIRHGKHVVLMNAELDATLGPILKVYADRANVVYSNSDGDEPGVAMNLVCFVRSMGLEPVVAGNLKGLYDPYRTPETQAAFAQAHGQKPSAVASFADGTKLAMELTVLANATGFAVARRGGYGPALSHVNESGSYFADKLLEKGMVDFLVGASPANGAFVLARCDDPFKVDYLRYFKMGDGPLYTFYTPFHLPQLAVPLTIARAVLFGDATVAPLGPPVCDAVAIAKKPLKAGEVLDGLGGFACYALTENYETGRREGILPIGLSEGCKLTGDVPKDCPVTYGSVALPPGRLCDRLREEQTRHFAALEGRD
jgi:predicted homoserine dehydrogenase-like protein